MSPPTYVSLGDSLAVGVGSTAPAERGYTPLVREALAREASGEVRLVALGVSGETSESFVGSEAAGSQLARAEEAVRGVPNLRLTLSIGGNDLLRTADLSDAARERALDEYERNLDLSLERLRAAAGPGARLAVLALYNPAPGTFTDAWVGRLNARTREVAGRYGAGVAAADSAFRGREERLTHWERYRDIHPTDDGYRVLAAEFEDALRSEAAAGEPR